MEVHKRPHDFKTQVPIFIKSGDKILMVVLSDEKSVDKDASELAGAYPDFEIQAGYGDEFSEAKDTTYGESHNILVGKSQRYL